MSPTAALQSPIFLFYVALAAGLLIVAGGVLAVLTWGLRKRAGQAWAAYRGWLILVPLLLLVFFLGREAAIVFLTVVAILGFHEFARAAGLSRDWVLTGAVDLGIAATGAASLMTDPTDGQPGWYGLFMTLPVFVTAVIVAVPVARNRAQGQLPLLALAIIGFVYFGWMFGHLAFLANARHAYSHLGYLVLAVELNDVAAYTCGKLFGRHPLRGNISPNKTWEGALGALVVSLLLPWALRFTFPHFQDIDCLAAGLIVGIGGQLGDLVVSVIKRDLGVKDLGATIPGHGGILDRIDSLIYVAPLFLHYLRFRHGLNPPLYLRCFGAL
jgi:phosphatidate cytidylyltransferase